MLIGMNQEITSYMCYMYHIHNDDDMSDIRDLNGLVNAISNSK